MKEEAEVCISGIAGRFPGCNNIDELRESLMNKVNLVADDRWKTDFKIDTKIGGMKDVFNFDLTYFGIARKLGDRMDPGTKKVLECSIEAIHDAGLSLDDISGTNTGVISSGCTFDTMSELAVTYPKRNYILMYSVGMYSNRVSYFLNLKGPSFVCNADWNGGMYSMEQSRHLLATRRVDSMLVATVSYVFRPELDFHYEKLGRLNRDGKTKSFSDDADGYSRSESVVVFLLQRKEDALRSYGTILGVGTSPEGSKSASFSERSINPDIALNVYKRAGVDPSQISYLEASGSASKVVDAAELNVLSKILLGKRDKALPIGSIKSNLGHTEASSSYNALVKLIIASETGLIPPNLNYSSPNTLVPSLLANKYKVVTEPTPLEGDLLALNNMCGFGGYAHALFRRNPKTKKRKCEVNLLPPDKIPRLVLLSGRNETLLQDILDKVDNMPIDEEFIALTHKTFGKGVKNHLYRGYTILHEGTQKYQEIKPLQIGYRRPFWILCSGMGSQWPGMGSSLMKIPLFANSIQYCHDLLKPFGLDLIDIITNPKPDAFDNILHCFVGITAVQIGLIDLLKALGIEGDGIFGHSVGELACAYLDGTFTAKQTILTSYMRGKVSVESGITGGRMAAVGKGYKELKEIIPEEIDIACRNSSTSCTISGPAEIVDNFLETLSSKGIFCRAVASAGVPYHSRYIKVLGTTFLNTVKEVSIDETADAEGRCIACKNWERVPLFLSDAVPHMVKVEVTLKLIPEPKLRSQKWISTSVPQEHWDKDDAKYSSAEYHTNNLLNPVLFEEALELIPQDAIIIEVAPRGLLKAIIEREMSSATYINLTAPGDNGEFYLLSSLGRIFNAGIAMDLTNLYPPVEFPVSRGTPSISPLFTWIHDEVFKLWSFYINNRYDLKQKGVYFNSILDQSNVYDSFSNYRYNNVPFVPAAALLDLILNLVMESNKSSKMLVKKFTTESFVKYGDERLVHAEFRSELGSFQIILGNTGLSTGIIEEYSQDLSPFYSVKPLHVPDIIFSHEDIYSYLLEKGLSPSRQYRNILQISVNNSMTSACVDVLWKGSFLSFFEAVFTFLTAFHSFKNNQLLFLKAIETLYLNLEELKFELDTVIKVYYDSCIELLWCDGMELHIPVMVTPAIDSSYINSLTASVAVVSPVSFCGAISIEKLFEECISMVYNETAGGERGCKKLKIFLLSDKLQEEQCASSIDKFNSNFQVELASFSNEKDLAYIKNQTSSDAISFIFYEGNEISNALEIIQKSHAGFLLSSTEITIPNLTCILCRSINKVFYYLYRSVKPYHAEPKSCEVVLNTPQWETILKSNLLKKDVGIVYVIGSSRALNYAKMVIQKCSKFDNYHKIRFLFVDNMSCKLDDENVKEHLRKDLKINILKNGKWSTILYYPTQLSQPLNSQEESIYQFQNIKAEGIHLKALGLNLSSTNNSREGLTAFEFSGVKNGKDICGLAKLNKSTRTLEMDSQFIWNKPSDMSHEDVVSILYEYSMAYYILNEIICGVKGNTNYLLVTNGTMPFSQVIIRLATKRGFNVITTYSQGQSEKILIQQLLPEVCEKNIIKLDNSLTEIIFDVTNNKGLVAAVSTSHLKDLSVVTNALAMFSYLFLFDSDPQGVLGMNIFLKAVNAFGIGGNTLFGLDDEHKKEIWSSVEADLRENIVRHDKTIIPVDTYNTDAINKLKEKRDGKKLIVQMNDNVKVSLKNSIKRICDTNKCNLIVGNENKIWYDLIQWLTSRGATKIILATKMISSLLKERLNILLNNNKFINLKICSSELLNTCEGANRFIQQVKEESEIETIFIFGKEYYDGFIDVCANLVDTQIIGVGNELSMHEGRKSDNKNHIIISVPPEAPSIKEIPQNLDALLNLPEPLLYISPNTINTGRKSKRFEFWNHLPMTPDEIEYLGRCFSDRASWKEVRTNTLPYSVCNEVPPVFIIPSLKRGQLSKLLGNLMHPAFEAVIPEKFNSFQQLGMDLMKDMLRFDGGVYTLICTDWSYHLGLLIASLLERRGKKLSLILLDISNSWLDIKLLDFIYLKMSNNLQSYSHKKLHFMEKGLKIMKTRLEHVLSSVIPDDYRYEGLCHVFHNDSVLEDDILKLNQFCSKKVMVHTMSENKYPENVNSTEAGHIINASVLVEHKDRAQSLPDRGYQNFIVEPLEARII